MGAPTQQPTATIRSLDGLRGLAILLVLWCHLDQYIRGGFGPHMSGLSIWLSIASWNAAVGVQLFFVLSGFLLFLPYARALLHPYRSAWPTTRTFYLRRAQRILPAYLVLLVALIVAMMVHAGIASVPWGELVFGVVPLYDLHRASFDLLGWNNPVLGRIDAPLWSLAVEWRFYLVLPLLAYVLKRLSTPRRVVLGVCGLVLLGLLVRVGASVLHYAQGIPDPADAPGLLGVASALLYGVRGSFIEIFALGMLVSLFYVHAIEDSRWAPLRRRMFGCLLLLLGTAGVLYASVWATFLAGRFEDADHFAAFIWPSVARHGSGALTFAVAGDWTLGVCAASLLFAVLCLPRSLGRVFRLAPLGAVGSISYSLYLWHEPLHEFAVRSHLPVPALLVVGGMFAWSAGSYLLIERPFLRHRRRLAPQPQTDRVQAPPEQTQYSVTVSAPVASTNA